MTTHSNRGVVIEWDHDRGFGFIDDGKQSFFLHRRDFRQHHTVPEKGDVVTFEIGNDKKGRTCAINAELMNDGGRFRAGDGLLLAVLLTAPALAIARLAHFVNPWWPAGAAILVSAFTYLFYASDKQRARSKIWRVPESTLHALEMIGGWPGAFIAQRRMRHKVSKVSYQLVFWLIVVAHQCIIVDYLLGWKMTHLVREYVTSR